MSEKKGCYWCERRKGLWCPRNRFHMDDSLRKKGKKVCEESLKIPLDNISEIAYYGSSCDGFKRGASREKIVFT